MQILLPVMLSLMMIVLNKGVVECSSSSGEMHDAWLEGVLGYPLEDIDVSWKTPDPNNYKGTTSYEMMHGPSDPNSSSETSESESSSDDEKADSSSKDENTESSSEEEKTFPKILPPEKLPPDKIFHDFVIQLHEANVDSALHLMKKALDIVQTTFPKELLAQTKDQLKDPDSIINQFIVEVGERSDKNNEVEQMYRAHFHAAITTYNSCLLFNIPREIDSPDQPIIPQIYFSILQKVIAN